MFSPSNGAFLIARFIACQEAIGEAFWDHLLKTSVEPAFQAAGDGAVNLFRHQEPDGLSLVVPESPGWQPAAMKIRRTGHLLSPCVTTAYDAPAIMTRAQRTGHCLAVSERETGDIASAQTLLFPGNPAPSWFEVGRKSLSRNSRMDLKKRLNHRSVVVPDLIWLNLCANVTHVRRGRRFHDRHTLELLRRWFVPV